MGSQRPVLSEAEKASFALIQLHSQYAAVKEINIRASDRQLQSLYPTDDEVYLNFAKAKGFEPTITELPDNARGFWIGDEKASRVLVYLHGGGYLYPLVSHIDILWTLKQSWDRDTSVVFLSYTLAPEAQYPTQLKQARHLLQHLLHSGKNPENITLAGDSAGGNLSLALVSHILHPHPNIEPLKLAKPLRGAVLVSPWGSFSSDAPSFTTKAANDSVNAPVLKRCAAWFMGTSATDAYNQPFTAPASWWKEVNDVVSDILIIYGAEEVMADDIQAFAEKFKESKPDLKVVSCAGESHDKAFLDPLFGITVEAESLKVLREWLHAHV